MAIADNANGTPAGSVGGVDTDDRLDRRAAEGAMVVVPTDAPGLYDVYSGETGRYLVDVIGGSCTCPDAHYRGRHCKHLRRVEQVLGERPVPDGARVDPTLRARLRVRTQAQEDDSHE